MSILLQAWIVSSALHFVPKLINGDQTTCIKQSNASQHADHLLYRFNPQYRAQPLRQGQINPSLLWETLSLKWEFIYFQFISIERSSLGNSSDGFQKAIGSGKYI